MENQPEKNPVKKPVGSMRNLSRRSAKPILKSAAFIGSDVEHAGSRTRGSSVGLTGSKEYVSRNYQYFKNYFNSKREKKPKRIKGLDGVYSLKRLAEI
ncbi:MAG: hypothetical protein GY850_41700 [bacterium]|nr:hypothetical protein [bacterium]